MEDKFRIIFEKLYSINISLYLREKDIMETAKVLNDLYNFVDPTIPAGTRTTCIKQYNRLLRKLKKIQKKEKETYASYRSTFLGYINECDIDTLREYAKELTKKEHKFRDDFAILESQDGDPVEIQRLKIVAKTYYDSIEAIYQYIDMKLQMSSAMSLKKTP